MKFQGALLLSILATPSLICLCVGKNITVSNTALPVDNFGNPLVTGETTVLQVGNEYYFYFNNWGGCPGVDCCSTESGCASCCFQTEHIDPCVYTTNHTVGVYSTGDFRTWTNRGTALPNANFAPGIEFRPQVVFSAGLQQYVMWYEDRRTDETHKGYVVAVSDTPEGPFQTLAEGVVMAGEGRVGDFDVFIDDDGTGYHIRTGLTIEKLNVNYTAGTGEVAELPVTHLEGPAMFKRQGVYFILAGRECCACVGGSNIQVYTAASPMGPYTYRGDVGSNPTPFNAHSSHNYVTRAQQTKVIKVAASDGTVQYVWLGNQWVTSQLPGNPRNNDLLYWSVLSFLNDTNIKQLSYQEQVVIDIAN